MPQNESVQIVEDLVARFQAALSTVSSKDLLVGSKAIEIVTTKSDYRRRLSAYVQAVAAAVETTTAAPIAAAAQGIASDMNSPLTGAVPNAYSEALSARARSGSAGDCAVMLPIPDINGGNYGNTYPWRTWEFHDTVTNRLYYVRVQQATSGTDTVGTLWWYYMNLATFETTVILTFNTRFNMDSYPTLSYGHDELATSFNNWYPMMLRSSTDPNDIRPCMFSMANTSSVGNIRVYVFLEGDANPVRAYNINNFATTNILAPYMVYDAQDKTMVTHYNGNNSYGYRMYWDTYIEYYPFAAAGTPANNSFTGGDPAGAIFGQTSSTWAQQNPVALYQADPTRWIPLSTYGDGQYTGSTLAYRYRGVANLPNGDDYGGVNNLQAGAANGFDAQLAAQPLGGAALLQVVDTAHRRVSSNYGPHETSNCFGKSPYGPTNCYFVYRGPTRRAEIRHMRMWAESEAKYFQNTGGAGAGLLTAWFYRLHYEVHDTFGRAIRRGMLQYHPKTTNGQDTTYPRMLQPIFFDEARDHLHVFLLLGTPGPVNYWIRTIYAT